MPQSVRRKLGLLPGETLAVTIESGKIVLSRPESHPPSARIITESSTGLPVLAVDKAGPKLTSEQVAEMLAEFP